MENWQDEIDQFLLPQGVLFSKKAIREDFIQEIRKLGKSVRLPLFTTTLLKDGFGSWAFRILSLIMMIACPLTLVLAKPGKGTGVLFMIIYVIISAPGFWMWSYCLLPLETKMESMVDLFKYKKEKSKEKSSQE